MINGSPLFRRLSPLASCEGPLRRDRFALPQKTSSALLRTEDQHQSQHGDHHQFERGQRPGIAQMIAQGKLDARR